MIHLDLFSGIGGFALAVDKVWPNSTHVFCEIDLFCQAVLAKHWPNSTIYGDIRTITQNTIKFRQQNRKIDKKEPTVWGQWEPCSGNANRVYKQKVDLLTGGFPCQPFSQAGRRRGTADNRFLWPEMLRVICLAKPTWVIAENVGGFVTWNEGVVLEQVCLDLENEGYEVQPLIIPAISVNAPHRRDRVWIVANRKGAIVKSKRSKTWNGWARFNGKVGWNQNWLEVATRLCRVDARLPPRLDRTPRLKVLGNAIVPQVAEEIIKAIKQTYD